MKIIMIVLQINKHLFATDRDIFFIGLYVSPCESAVYGVTQNGYGIEPLEQCVMDLYDKFDNFDIIVCGDLNARTGSQNGTTDMLTDPLSTNSECFWERKSRDSTKKRVWKSAHIFLQHVQLFSCERSLWPWF